MDIFIWLVKFGSTHIANAAIARLQKSELSRNIRKTMESWKKDLPDSDSLLTVESLFPNQEQANTNDLPPSPSAVLESIENGKIPTAEDWEHAFIGQWNYVRGHIAEPQPFYLITKEDALSHLRLLAQQVHADCVKSPDLFQQDTYEILREIATSNADSKEYIELLREINNKLPPIASGASSVDSHSDNSDLHSEIDLAISYRKERKPELTIFKLSEIEKRHLDKLSPREKYRIHANRALASQDQDKFEEAAKDFIACRKYQPDDEAARCFEASGYYIQGDTTKVSELAIEILADFPESTTAYALFARSAHSSTSLSELEEAIPTMHRSDADVAFALSIRAIDEKDYRNADSYARKLLECDSDNPIGQSHLAGIIIESEILKNANLLAIAPPVDNDRLEEASNLLQESIKTFSLMGAKKSEARCNYALGKIFSLQANETEAEKHFLKASELSPKETGYSIQLAMHLHEQDNLNAIQILENIEKQDETLVAPTMLAEIKWENSTLEIKRETIDLLDVTLKRFPGINPTTNFKFVATCIAFNQEMQNHEKAHRILKVAKDNLSELEHPILQASLLQKEGLPKDAKHFILEALELANLDTPIWHKHALSEELMRQKQYEHAFHFLKSYVPSHCLSIDTRLLVASAQRCNQDAFLIGFLASLRENGFIDYEFIDLELGLLERYHAGTKCISIIETLFEVNAKQLSDEFSRELRVRQSCLGLNYDKNTAFHIDTTQLPLAIHTRPYIGFLVVLLLLRDERYDQARQYAYTLLRNHDSSPWSHKAIISSYLLYESPNQSYYQPKTVAVGTAFKYRDEYTKHEDWIILESEPNPRTAWDEYPPDHHLFSKALDKKVGDSFPFKQNIINDRVATILQIDDKKVYRFNKSMREWEDRFEEFFLVAVPMQKKPDGELDISPVLKFTDERAKLVEERDEIYRTNPFFLRDILCHFADRHT